MNSESLEEILYSIKNSKLSLILASTKDCGVCTSIEPRVKNLIRKYPNINYKHIFIDSMIRASGEFTIFTVPTIIIFAEDKEIHRESRFIDFQKLNFEITRWYDYLFNFQ
ncbi:MAG: thioredoxin family protein [Clostridium argentinense]|uniref:Thioredoxin family protein n=1 Tax=Clostridium faecium TaxID=2762223 RepID=A0ABR8YPH1_9CLOT|nr:MULTISPECIES: thioredoxin family protein [Clostridium]MBD8046101.1 thioredoxin family protein [Clostridium faecium]MBS5824748.1 thioredoxin family protein [Clostridium argentinense]MDU1349576.1 thioredoxin family protein [Clostridium argentinense]